MGWASGTELFDEVLEAIFSLRTQNTVALVKAVERTIKAFEGHDADCLLETKFAKNAVFCQAYLNLYPDLFYYDTETGTIAYKGDDE